MFGHKCFLRISQLIRKITDTPHGLKYEIGYIDKTTRKGETTSGLLREIHITFAHTAEQIAPLEIPGEINLTASKIIIDLPRSTNFWGCFGKGIDKLGDMGSVSSPREAYGVESETIFKFDSIKNVEYRYNEKGECYDTIYFKTSIREFKNCKGIKISKEEWEKLEKLW